MLETMFSLTKALPISYILLIIFCYKNSLAPALKRPAPHSPPSHNFLEPSLLENVSVNVMYRSF